MSRTAVILITIAAWALSCAFAAHIYVISHLGLPGTDAYADNWSFQLIAFGIVRFPFWLVGLLAVVSLEVVMLKPTHRKLK